MTDFELSLDSKTYTCSTYTSNGKDTNWVVKCTHGNITTTINIPMENKITRAKVILFIEAFHVALHKAFEEQLLDQNYVWNQKTQIT